MSDPGPQHPLLGVPTSRPALPAPGTTPRRPWPARPPNLLPVTPRPSAATTPPAGPVDWTGVAEPEAELDQPAPDPQAQEAGAADDRTLNTRPGDPVADESGAAPRRSGMRGLIVSVLSGVITAVRWLPRIVWWCTGGLLLLPFRVLKWGADILSEAAAASHGPPRRGRPASEQARPQASGVPPVPERARGGRPKRRLESLTHDPYLPPGRSLPLRAVVVRPPDRPVVFLAPPATDTEPEADPDTPLLWDLPATGAVEADTWPAVDPTDDNRAVAPVPAGYDAPPIAPAPLSRLGSDRLPPLDEGAAPPKLSGGFAQGAGLLALVMLGSGLGFGLGFGMHMIPSQKVALIGLMLMIAGVGGALLGMMLVNEWVGSMRFQIPAPAQLLVRVFGVLAVACLLAAFAATTIPREYWPV